MSIRKVLDEMLTQQQGLLHGREKMRELTGRFARLLAGLFLYALGIVLTMKANIGYAPWEVFHAGVGKAIGMTIGNVSIITGLLIVVLTFAMGEKLGLGTLLNWSTSRSLPGWS